MAQTFTLNESKEISAISVYLTELPTNTLQIKVTPTKVGIPDSTQLLGLGQIRSTDCVLGWNKIPLKYPLPLSAGVEYAFIVATANFQGKVGTAKVGQRDNLTNTWVTSQKSQGVMLISANESTWEPVSDEDVMFRLHTPTYSGTDTKTLLTVAAANSTDWLLSTSLDLPASTSVRFYITNGTQTYDLNTNNPTYTPASLS